jgi:hypothetical protein
VQKIKPRVERLCQELGLDYGTEENDGRIYVDQKGGRVGAPPPLPEQPGGYEPGYGGGHQQRPPQQHHQRPPPQKEEEELDIFGCIKGCCLVM